MTFHGEPRTFARVGDDGMTITFRFCPDCGSTVYYDIDALPGFVMVPIGAFADPTFPAPAFSVYENRRHAWVTLPEACEHVD